MRGVHTIYPVFMMVMVILPGDLANLILEALLLCRSCYRMVRGLLRLRLKCSIVMMFFVDVFHFKHFIANILVTLMSLNSF